MTSEAFKGFMRGFRRGQICCVRLTPEQADEVKAYVDARIRDRSNVAPDVSPRSSSHAGGCLGSGRESQSSSSVPTPNSSS